MNLTYRGIRYQSPLPVSVPQLRQGQALPHKYRLSNAQDANKLIIIKPIHYFTYRGVSYTKSLVYDPQTKLLLDIDQQ